MPRYFFNTRIGDELVADPEGEELRNPDRAWEVARSMIRELLESELAPPRRIHEAHRRPLGAHPPAFLGALGLVALIIGLILLITGPWISAIIALAVFIGLIGLFIPAVRHEPHSQVALETRVAFL